MASGIFPKNKSLYNIFLKKAKRWPRRRTELIARALSDAVELILYRSKTYYLTGGALKVQTGRLRSSVAKSPVFKQGSTLRIVYGTNVFYGAIWERGRRTKSGLDRRAFLAPAYMDQKSEVVRLLREAGIAFK